MDRESFHIHSFFFHSLNFIKKIVSKIKTSFFVCGLQILSPQRAFLISSMDEDLLSKRLFLHCGILKITQMFNKKWKVFKFKFNAKHFSTFEASMLILFFLFSNSQSRLSVKNSAFSREYSKCSLLKWK